MNIADHIREIEQLEDGTSVYEIGPEPKAPPKKALEFYDNIADTLEDDVLKRISHHLLEAIEEDIESRKDWITAIEKAKNYLPFSLEDVSGAAFKQACRTFDTTLAEALVRFYSVVRAELLPPSGPVGFKIEGQETEELQFQGEKLRNFLNFYLTTIDKPYYSDFEKFLMYLGLYGSCFKKVYYDPLLEKPISRFIVPEDFIANNQCSSILDSVRLTHVLHLSKREILLNQQSGAYRKIELPYLKLSQSSNDDDQDEESKKDGVDLNVYTNASSFSIYEVHAYLNLKDFENTGETDSDESIPLPYIVTIDKHSKEVLSIKRNWNEDDALKKRINYFVQYNYLPGFGIYGIGLAHLIGSNAIALTQILRQSIDAATFKNFPGGLRVRGIKQQDTTITVGPGEWIPVDTNGLPLAEAFMKLPYDDPSVALLQLRADLIQATKELASTSEMGMMDSKEDIPTGTAVAFLETANRIQSAVLRSIHYSFTEELQLLAKIFSQTMGIETFSNAGDEMEITSEDFIDQIRIIPVSDPSTNSIAQRVMKARSALDIALQDPNSHNMPEVFRMVYKAQGLDEEEIDLILKKEETEVLPLDPASENANIILGLPVKAAIYQEHAAHKFMHASLAESYPDLKPAIFAHIREHEALEYIIQMQQLLGQELPPEELLQNPEIQNSIALALAQSLESSGFMSTEQEQSIDPNEVIMAQVAQKQEEIAARERIAQEKTEMDAFKATLELEKEKAKIESNENIAQLKAEVELIKHGENL